MGEAEEVVDDLEPRFALGEINAADVEELLELAVHVVAQEG